MNLYPLIIIASILALIALYKIYTLSSNTQNSTINESEDDTDNIADDIYMVKEYKELITFAELIKYIKKYITEQPTFFDIIEDYTDYNGMCIYDKNNKIYIRIRKHCISCGYRKDNYTSYKQYDSIEEQRIAVIKLFKFIVQQGV